MKTQRLFLILGLALVVLALGEASVFATGKATASGEVNAKTKQGEIQKDKRDRTGGLTVDKVTVRDKFGRGTRTLVRGTDYDVTGDTSTSPTIVFKSSANLSGGEYCTVEMTSTKAGTFTMDIVFS